jgi:hypothetical protein
MDIDEKFAARLQQIMRDKNVDQALWGECWSICDNAIVIYQEDNPPAWLPNDYDRDEDGNTAEYVDKVKGATT